jgi:hypothetical protein
MKFISVVVGLNLLGLLELGQNLLLLGQHLLSSPHQIIHLLDAQPILGWLDRKISLPCTKLEKSLTTDAVSPYAVRGLVLLVMAISTTLLNIFPLMSFLAMCLNFCNVTTNLPTLLTFSHLSLTLICIPVYDQSVNGGVIGGGINHIIWLVCNLLAGNALSSFGDSSTGSWSDLGMMGI